MTNLKFSLVAILGLLVVNVDAVATPPCRLPDPKPEDFIICPAINPEIYNSGDSTSADEDSCPLRQYSALPHGKSGCRKQLVWDREDWWLCKRNDLVFLAGYPADRLGMPQGKTRLDVTCIKLPEKCANPEIFVEKQCLALKEKVTWAEVDKYSDPELQKFGTNCPGLEVQYRTLGWREAVNVTSEEEALNSKAEHRPGEYDRNATIYSFPSEAALKIENTAVYCIQDSHFTRKVSIWENGGEKIKDSFQVTHFTLLLPEIPRDWMPTFLAGQKLPAIDSKPVPEQAKIPAGLSCKADSDCIRLTTGACAVPAVGKNLKQHAKPHDGCRCLKGPVFFGCAPKKQ